MNLFNKNKHLPHLEDNLSFGKQILIFAWEVSKVVVISLVIIVPIRYFLIKPFYVNGASMEPNFYNHEYLIIDEITYRFSEPQRGDTVVFHYPLDRRQYFIKRIIGLPEETVLISNGKVKIFNELNPEGVVLAEDYLFPAIKTNGDVEVKLGIDEYYLLGDNRTASLDSRIFGIVLRKDIVGRALLRGWPFTRFGLVLSDIEYNL